MNVISPEYYPNLIGKVIETMDIQPGQSILNLGSGIGRKTFFIARKIDIVSSILGSDINRDRELSWNLPSST
jgi:ubiquinone/menaquinone biosynthesis C-methylase UbiE